MLVSVALILLVGAAFAQEEETTKAPCTHDLEWFLNRSPHYSLILDLLRSSGVLDQLMAADQMTFFAPTNAALLDMPTADYNALKADTKRLFELLTYHASIDKDFNIGGHANDRVLNSMNNHLPIRINVYRDLHTLAAEGVNITDRNHGVCNGHVHGIDGIMQPPSGDIVDIIGNNPDLSMTSQFIASTGLASIIRADSNITVFAPNDAAWAKLNPAVMTYLQNTPDMLREVLLYHVIPKTTLYSIGMRHQMLFQSADRHKDQLMLIEGQDGDGDLDVFINSAKVLEKDISATNGVLHVTDDALIPTNILVKLEDMGLGHHLG